MPERIQPHKFTSAQRKERIRAMVQEQRSVVIAELAELFRVSEMTIRRDLDDLERQGHVTRIHGGAVKTEMMGFEFNFRKQRLSCHHEKRIIAEFAAGLVEPGHRLLLDSGTTTLELAMQLRDRADISVITPSLAVAAALQFSPGVQTILLGGILRQGLPYLTGAITENNLEAFNVDVAFMGCQGFGLHGEMYLDDLEIARTDRHMRNRARLTYVLADHTKAGQKRLIHNGQLQEVEALITDDGIDPESLEALRANGIRVLVAPQGPAAG